MKNRIIAISREFGSGGRTIGKGVAEKLNIPCYDSVLIQKIAQESGFTESYVSNVDETTPAGFMESVFSPRILAPTNIDYLWEIQQKVIIELAEKESCVIVGRCADYILRERANCLTVFIHASIKYRAERIVKEYGEREESPLCGTISKIAGGRGCGQRWKWLAVIRRTESYCWGNGYATEATKAMMNQVGHGLRARVPSYSFYKCGDFLAYFKVL